MASLPAIKTAQGRKSNYEKIKRNKGNSAKR